MHAFMPRSWVVLVAQQRRHSQATTTTPEHTGAEYAAPTPRRMSTRLQAKRDQ